MPQRGGTEENMRIGMGYDVHRLTEGRRLIMGGRGNLRKGASGIRMRMFWCMR